MLQDEPVKPSPDSFLSVGLDVGTTTTHLTVSRLYFSNASTFTEVPRLMITAKEVIHHGQIHQTPITDDGIIDAEGVARLVEL
jgi:ethanolamine utilization protein EutA